MKFKKRKKLVLISRSLLGLLLIVLAIDHLLGFLPHQISPEGAALTNAVRDSGYLWPLLTGVELVCGLCLLAGYFAPLALLLFAPVALNSFLFHLVLDPSGLPVAILLLLLETFLLWSYRYNFEELLQVKAQVW